MATRFDVAVVGGGSAGIAAALSAAREGARTLLAESGVALGGNATNALVHTICGLYLAAAEGDAVPANPGLPLRFAEALAAAGGARAPERAGKVWVLPTDPPVIERQAAALCASTPSLSVLTRARVVRASLADAPRSSSALVVAREGAVFEEIEAGVVVDASGDGVAAALGGSDFELSPPESLQSPSLIFKLSGVDAAELDGFSRLKLSVAVAGAVRSGALPRGCESILVRPGGARGEAYVTLNLPDLPKRPYAPLDPDYVSELEEVGRERAEWLLDHLRATRTGFGRAALMSWPRRVGIRETRRVLGRVVVSREDVLSGRRSDDEVARSSWPIELWNDHRRAHFAYPDGACSIPLGALQSRSHPELAMAGRCLSATHDAHGALRVIGTALATGEAAGVAAALAVDGGLSLRDVAPARVRAAIGAAAAG